MMDRHHDQLGPWEERSRERLEAGEYAKFSAFPFLMI